MAWDSLFAPLPVRHISEDEVHSDPVQYHLQLESFFYALIWLVGKGIDTFDLAAQLEGSERKRCLVSTIGGMEFRCDTTDRAVLMRSWVTNLALMFEASFRTRERLGGEPQEDWLDGEPPRVWVTYDSFMDIIMQ